MVEMKPSRRKVETVRFFGLPLISTVTEEFVLEKYPKSVRRSLQKSTVPTELYPDALAVIGRAYGRAVSNWTSEQIGDTPDLAWRVPSPDDFQSCVDNLRETVGVDALVGLSDRLFGRAETKPELFLSLQTEIDVIFNPPEKEK